MSENAIVVENLCKSYRVGHKSGAEARLKYAALRALIAQGAQSCRLN